MAKQLKNKPLVEALVELKWALHEAAPNVHIDQVYPLFLGRFHERIRDAYPHVEVLPSAHIPDEVTPYLAKYRFRASKDGWPLVQAGPGVATLNFTQSYDWETFSAAARPFFGQLLEAYAVNGEGPRPKFVSAVLRFINAIEFDVSQHDVLQFLAEKFHTNLRLPDKVQSSELVGGPPQGLQVGTTFNLVHPAAMGTVRFSTGTKQDQPAVLWEITIQSTGDQVPQKQDALEAWLTQAHEVVETWFFALIEGDLEKLFEGGQ